jgi:hypothetical protein
MPERPKNAEPFAFWARELKAHPIGRDGLEFYLHFLRRHKETVDMQAVLTAFLGSTQQATAVDYERLAILILQNTGQRKAAGQALQYAADIALARGTALDMTRVADTLFVHKFTDRVPDLLLKATEIDPAAPRPLLMLLNFAATKKDAALMGDALERFLALGWPDTDEAWRTQAHQTAEKLAASLREAGSDAEADKLVRRLTESEARDVFVRLTWTGDAWIDLVVEEPLGATATYLSPRTVFGGSIVKSGRGKHPESIYVCPRGFDGEYTVRIEVTYNNPKNPAREATIEVITREGTSEEQLVSRNISVAKPKPVVVTLKGGRRTKVLPYQASPPPAEPEIKPAAAPGASAPKPALAPTGARTKPQPIKP